MASRPLPPGRRGRGPRVTSGLHNLPEIKLLDVPETSSSAYSSSSSSSGGSQVDVVVVDAPVQAKTTTTKSYTPKAPAPAQPQPVEAPHPVVFEPLSTSTADKVVAVDSPVPAPVAEKHVAVHDVIAKLEERQHVEQQALTAHSHHSHHSHGHVAHTATVTSASPVQHSSIVKPAVPATPAVLMKAPTVAPVYAPTTVAVPAPVSPAATIPPQTLSASTSSAPVAQPGEGESANLGKFHPFYLLLPVDSVPEVPESIECIYDDAALEMQKNVMKVIKKLLGKKDKMKLEDFKINSRLFGNNFMEPYEYLDSIVKDFGGIRALQLIPCLLMIQADFMKRSGLLLAARNYRMRNIAALETQCQAMRAAPAPAPAPAQTPVPVPTPVPAPQSSEPQPVADPAPLLKTNPDAAKAAVVLSLMAGVDDNEVAEKSDTLHEEVDAVEPASTAEPIVSKPNEEEDQQQSADVPVVAPTEAVEAPTVAMSLNATPTSFENVQKEPEIADVQESPPVEIEETHSSPTLSAVVESIVDSAEVAIQSIHVPEPVEKSMEEPAEVAQPAPVVESNAPEVKIGEVAAVAAADAEFQSLEDFLPPEFREAFASSSGSQSKQAVSTKPPATVHSAESSTLKSLESASSSSSFAEAENLFGERFSTGSTSSDNAGNLFGESFSQPASSATSTSTGSAPAAGADTAKTATTSHPAPKRVHSQLLFGFATAGADTDSDSDSDDSDF